VPQDLGVLDGRYACGLEVSTAAFWSVTSCANASSEDDEMVMCITEQRQGQPSVIR